MTNEFGPSPELSPDDQRVLDALVDGGFHPDGLEMPTPADLGMMALSGCLVGAAHFMVIESFRNAEATLVAPFKYFTMVWAVVLGFVIWGDLPNTATLAGVSLVIGSGIYILHRETRR